MLVGDSTIEYLNQREAAALLGISQKYLHFLEVGGKGPVCIKMNERVYKYPLSGLKAFIAQRVLIGGSNGNRC